MLRRTNLQHPRLVGTGFIATDCGAVDFLNQGHYWTGSPPEAVAAALRNGSDMEIGIPGPWGHGFYYQVGSGCRHHTRLVV